MTPDLQSSLCGTSGKIAMGPMNSEIAGGRFGGMVGKLIVCWIHWFPKVVALITPVYLLMGWGSCKRSFPTLDA